MDDGKNDQRLFLPQHDLKPEPGHLRLETGGLGDGQRAGEVKHGSTRGTVDEEPVEQECGQCGRVSTARSSGWTQADMVALSRAHCMYE